MQQYHTANTSSVNKRVTLGRLKEQLYTLNMQMLLAIQSHDEEIQKDIKIKMDELQVRMDQLLPGGKMSS